MSFNYCVTNTVAWMLLARAKSLELTLYCCYKDVVLEVMKAYIEKCSSAAGVLIEGYPRTTEQALKYDNVVSAA